MKKKCSLIVLLVALLCACLLLAACGKEEGNGNAKGYVYVPTYSTMGDSKMSVSNVYYAGGDTIYFSSYEKIGDRVPTQEELELYGNEPDNDWLYEENGYVLYKSNIDGSDAKKLEGYVPGGSAEVPGPAGTEGTNYYFSSMQVDASGNIWVYESASYYSFDESTNTETNESRYVLRKLDENGNELSVIYLNEEELSAGSDWFYVSAVAVDAEGNIFVAANDQVFCVDEEGKVRFSLTSSNGWIDTLVVLSDGVVRAKMYEGNSYVLSAIDVAKQDFDSNDKMTMPSNAYNIFPGSSEYLFYYINGSDLFAWNTAKGEAEFVLNLIDCDINSSEISGLIAKNNDEIIVIPYSYTDGGTEMVTLSKTPANQVKQKTILTLGTLYLDYDMRAKIVQFNKTNPDYRIQVTEYYSNSDNYEDAITKMNTEIAAGKVPDLIVLDQMPYKQYASKGLLEDLLPYLEADKEIGGREALIESVVDAACVDGKLYQAFSSFQLISIVGAADIVGSEMGWTMDELIALTSQNPDASVFAYASQTDLLTMLLICTMDDYINWDTGECNFDSEGFIRMLEFCATLPKEFNFDDEDYLSESQMLQNGSVLLSMAQIYDFKDFGYTKALFGRDITFKGFPTENGIGNGIVTSGGIGISSTSKYKDVAWEFIREMFTEEYQTSNVWSMPVRQDVFDEMLAEAMKEDPNVAGGWSISDGSGFTYDSSKPLTQDEVDQLLELIASADRIIDISQDTAMMIVNEAAPFFAGDKSAADTAALIQSKMKIYVNEQR